MKYFVDLFSGIGGFHLAADMADFKFDKYYFSEIDEYAVKVYRKNFPQSLELGDIKNVEWNKMPKGEYFVCGGFPCQPFSISGLRRGSTDERNLWSECARMLRELQPEIAIFENVPQILNIEKGRIFERILFEISESGYDCEWQTLSASGVGAPHKRARVWIVAYPKNDRRRFLQDKKRNSSKNSKEEYRQWAPYWFKATGNYIFEFRQEDVNSICRVDDGIPGKLDKDRLRCLGNAIVPQVAARILAHSAFDIWR